MQGLKISRARKDITPCSTGKSTSAFPSGLPLRVFSHVQCTSRGPPSTWKRRSNRVLSSCRASLKPRPACARTRPFPRRPLGRAAPNRVGVVECRLRRQPHPNRGFRCSLRGVAQAGRATRLVVATTGEGGGGRDVKGNGTCHLHDA